jgi:hypothetical protein
MLAVAVVVVVFWVLEIAVVAMALVSALLLQMRLLELLTQAAAVVVVHLQLVPQPLLILEPMVVQVLLLLDTQYKEKANEKR